MGRAYRTPATRSSDPAYIVGCFPVLNRPNAPLLAAALIAADRWRTPMASDEILRAMNSGQQNALPAEGQRGATAPAL